MAKNTLARPVGGAVTLAGNARVESDDPEARHDPGALEDDGGEQPSEALLEVLAQLGEDQDQARCIVYRIATSAGADDEYLYEVSAADFARRGGVGDIAKRYGAGTYRIRVYKGGEIYTHKRIKIGAPIVPEMGSVGETAALRSDLTAALAAQSALLKESIEKIVAAQPKPMTLRDQLGDLVALKDFLGGGSAKPASALSQIKDMAELLKSVKDLVPAGAGEGGMGGALMRLGERFLPEIVEAVKKAQPGAVDAAGRAITELPEGADMGVMRDLQLKMALDFLVDSAARNLPAETYADLAVDKVPVAELNRLLNRVDWFAELNKLDVRVADHQPWFIKLREEILTILKQAGTLTDAPAVSTLDGKGSPPDAAQPPSGVSEQSR